MKRVALKEYLALKKGKQEFKSDKIIYKAGDFFAKDEFNKIIKVSKGTVLKPLYKDNNYYVVKLIKK
jgi:hypothetical protein